MVPQTGSLGSGWTDTTLVTMVSGVAAKVMHTTSFSLSSSNVDKDKILTCYLERDVSDDTCVGEVRICGVPWIEFYGGKNKIE